MIPKTLEKRGDTACKFEFDFALPTNYFDSFRIELLLSSLSSTLSTLHPRGSPKIGSACMWLRPTHVRTARCVVAFFVFCLGLEQSAQCIHIFFSAFCFCCCAARIMHWFLLSSLSLSLCYCCCPWKREVRQKPSWLGCAQLFVIPSPFPPSLSFIPFFQRAVLSFCTEVARGGAVVARRYPGSLSVCLSAALPFVCHFHCDCQPALYLCNCEWFNCFGALWGSMWQPAVSVMMMVMMMRS